MPGPKTNWMLLGECWFIHEALTELDSKRWFLFVLFLGAPIVLLFLLMKHGVL